jgi:hypothetical protein
VASEPTQMHIARRHLGPGIEDGDQGLCEVFLCEARSPQHGASGSTREVVSEGMTGHGNLGMVSSYPPSMILKIKYNCHF